MQENNFERLQISRATFQRIILKRENRGRFIFSVSWRWKQYIPSKLWWVSINVPGVTFQKHCHINTFYGQNTRVWEFQEGGSCGNNCILRGSEWCNWVNEHGVVKRKNYSRVKTWWEIRWWVPQQQNNLNVASQASKHHQTKSIQSSLDIITYQLKIFCERYEFAFVSMKFCSFIWMQLQKSIWIHNTWLWLQQFRPES
jgi:hypothetical protein